jgi:xylulokinase
MPLFLSLDAGTTSLKAALFDEDGSLLSVNRQEYALETPRPNWVEIDPEVYWQACCTAIREVLTPSVRTSFGDLPQMVKSAIWGRQESPSNPLSPPFSQERKMGEASELRSDGGGISSLCISSQGETLICLDTAGQPTRKAIVWLDNRASAEAAEIAHQFDPAQVYTITGQPEITPAWPACKILWIKHNEPEVFARTTHFLLLEDYLLYRLTGRFVTDGAIQTSSLLLDINTRQWWQPMLGFLDLPADRLPELLPSGKPVGSILSSVTDELGLPEGVLAVTGGMDQVLGAIGAGNFLPGVISETTGGALGIVASLDCPVFDTARRIPCHIHAARPSGAASSAYCLLPWGQTAGMALKWFRDQFYSLESQADLSQGLDPYDRITAEAASVPSGCDGLVILPHLEGAVCPEFNPHARAVFFGLTLRHTRAHLARGILEAVAFMLRRNLELVEALGVPVIEVRSMGGGARSDLWLQIKADVLQKPVTRLATEETALLGAAILGAVASGVYPDLPTAVKHMARLAGTLHPNPANAEVYHQAYLMYVELYERLSPMFI